MTIYKPIVDENDRIIDFVDAIPELKTKQLYEKVTYDKYKSK